MTDSNEGRSRRAFIQQLGIGLGAGVLLAAVGCRRTESTVGQCNDLSGVPETQRQMRQTLQYQATTPNPAKHCGNCKLYKAPAPGSSCGGCQLFQGPVELQGYCTGWQAKM